MTQPAPTKTQEDLSTSFRRDFPILESRIHGHPLVYLDSAASAQKPQRVLDAIHRLYREDYSNVHRGVHTLSQRATIAYENARVTIADFVGVKDSKEIIFTRGTTESINLVAQSWGRANLKPGDKILLTTMEHHSNIVPWQLVAEATGAEILVAPMTVEGDIHLEKFRELLEQRPAMVALAHVSNALGTVNPVEKIIPWAKTAGALVLLDGAQGAPHLQLDLDTLGVDFYAFSGHKMYGPSGIGILWGRRELLEAMPPWQGGGDMILTVTFEKTTYNEIPHKFEAGTPSIAAAVGLAAACDYLKDVGMERVAQWEDTLTKYTLEKLEALEGVRLVGTPKHRAGVVSFSVDGVHPHDLGTLLDGHGVAIRAGHHCAQPVMDFYGIPATARASFGLYNSRDDVDALISAIGVAQEIFG